MLVLTPKLYILNDSTMYNSTHYTFRNYFLCYREKTSSHRRRIHTLDNWTSIVTLLNIIFFNHNGLNFHLTINPFECVQEYVLGFLDIKDQLTFCYDIGCVTIQRAVRASCSTFYIIIRDVFGVRWPLIFIAINWKYSRCRGLVLLFDTTCYNIKIWCLSRKIIIKWIRYRSRAASVYNVYIIRIEKNNNMPFIKYYYVLFATQHKWGIKKQKKNTK